MGLRVSAYRSSTAWRQAVAVGSLVAALIVVPVFLISPGEAEIVCPLSSVFAVRRPDPNLWVGAGMAHDGPRLIVFDCFAENDQTGRARADRGGRGKPRPYRGAGIRCVAADVVMRVIR